MMETCPHCGTGLPVVRDAYCGMCAEPLDAPPASPARPGPPPEPAETPAGGPTGSTGGFGQVMYAGFLAVLGLVNGYALVSSYGLYDDMVRHGGGPAPLWLPAVGAGLAAMAVAGVAAIALGRRWGLFAYVAAWAADKALYVYAVVALGSPFNPAAVFGVVILVVLVQVVTRRPFFHRPAPAGG